MIDDRLIDGLASFASADDIFVWWLDADAVRALVRRLPRQSFDLLGKLNVPEYIAEAVRSLQQGQRTLRGGLRVSRMHVPRELAELGPDRCAGVAVHGCDLDCLQDLPGFVTDAELRLITPPPRTRGSLTERHITAFIRRGCRCGRAVDLIYNQPVVIDRRSGALGAPHSLELYCESCYTENGSSEQR